MIALAGVSRVFQMGSQSVHALADVNLAIPEGEYIALMGPSGSGKSTLLNILGCLDQPTSGTYRLEGIEVARMSEGRLSKVRSRTVGFVFQFFNLIPRLKAKENVEVPLLFAGLDSGERKRRIDRALSAVGLSGRANHRPDQLSGGEQQRVAIARAIVMGPAILLADEPTGNLDTTSGLEIIELLENLHHQGMTLIVVTHNPEIGSRADRLLQLKDGHILKDSASPIAGSSGS